MNALQKVNQLRKTIYKSIWDYVTQKDMTDVYTIKAPFEIGDGYYASQFEVEGNDPRSEEASVYVYINDIDGDTQDGKYVYELGLEEMAFFYDILINNQYTK
jgi:hypothetical protein